ncbi:MAG: substrate-binding domain-containing protein, partial [Clostridiales bacterium]|nr:substrate-binding domain-containing protein [Clostridiales bacterium]
EDQFIADGYGIIRKDVMYNFFYIVGPTADPAGVSGEELAKDAFAKIAAAKSTFLSRADKSGTNTKELAVWKLAEITPNAAEYKWYLETGLGMLDLLNMASEMNGYTLTDSGTWGSAMDKLTNMKIVVQGDPVLFNPYGVITVNPEKYPNLNSKAAQAFTDFITSAEGQELIGSYSKNGQKLFVPNA